MAFLNHNSSVFPLTVQTSQMTLLYPKVSDSHGLIIGRKAFPLWVSLSAQSAPLAKIPEKPLEPAASCYSFPLCHIPSNPPHPTPLGSKHSPATIHTFTLL